MLQLASELGRRNITVAVLSNNSALMAEHWPTIVPPLAPLFHGRMFCSGQLRAAKPSPAAYLRCLDGLAVTPGATLFVDDSAVNVAGARQVGLAGHRFVDLPSLRQALAACGLV
jgi:putative hydrolase of the HAD superfamily